MSEWILPVELGVFRPMVTFLLWFPWAFWVIRKAYKGGQCYERSLFVIVWFFKLEYSCLQCCISVCSTMWIRWMCTNTSSPYGLPPFHPTPLGHHGALSWAPYRAASKSAICPWISPPCIASTSPHLTLPGRHQNAELSTLCYTGPSHSLSILQLACIHTAGLLSEMLCCFWS